MKRIWYDELPMKDAVVVLLLSLSVATAVTAHLATAYGLVFHHPRWRAAAALFLPPLAIVWGHGAGMRTRPRAVLTACIVYAVARVLALFQRPGARGVRRRAHFASKRSASRIESASGVASTASPS